MNKSGLFIILLLFLFSCTTQKNTPVTRTFHNTTAHYNVYFNGKESFDAANEKIDKSYKENYNQDLSIYKYNIPAASKLTSSEMDVTLEKMGKTISRHSITVKPKLKGTLTPKDKELLKKNEYCKWIDDSYLLIGKANYYKADYNKALRSFRQITNQFKTEESRFEAQLWIAKVYIQQEKYTDALNYLSELENDVRHPKKLDKDINLTFADYYINQKDYKNAISRIQKGIDLSKKRKEKSRLYFILAQLEQKNGNNKLASDYLEKVIKMNTNYDMTFTAKIMQATTITKGQNSSYIKKELRKLLKDEKNEEYQDQIYYALATIEQKEDNLTDAISYYKLSANKSVTNNTQKAISFLALADIFFEQKDFYQSGQYYDSTMQYLNKDYSSYDSISKTAQNTIELVKYLGEVKKQDSLQRIAKMPEGDRNELIDSIIAEIIAKEQLQQQNQANPYYDPLDNNTQTTSQQGGQWYMYSPTLVSRGQSDFKKKWGNRKLEDDWRRKNKSVLSDDGDINNGADVDSSRITDNKKREYYLQDLPLNDSLMEISDQIIKNSLFNAAEVYEQKIQENKPAIETYETLIKRFPDNELKLETYYRLYNLYKNSGDNTKANYYKGLITSEYPDSKYAKMLLDPNFLNKLMATEKQALTLYDNTLKNYNKGDYYTTIEQANEGIKLYPNSQAYPNFLFLKAKAYGSIGQTDSLKNYLNIIVTKFDKTDIANLSKEILDLMNSGKYDYDIYKNNPNEKHIFFVIVDKAQNTNTFRFKIKSQAELFTNTKTFTINDKNWDAGNSIVSVEFFDNATEASEFYKSIIISNVFNDISADKYQAFIISQSNFAIFSKDKMLDKYTMFFKKTYSF